MSISLPTLSPATGRRKVVGVGAGGHATVVIDAILSSGRDDLVWLLDSRRELWGTRVLDVPIIGGDDRLDEIRHAGIRHAVIGVGGAQDTTLRRTLYEWLKSHGMSVIDVVHPTAIVSRFATFGEGVTVLAGAIINPRATLGANVTVNTGAIVEHDCVVQNHVHVAPGVRLASGVHVGEAAHVGLGACVKQGTRIGEGAVVGAGAVVIRDVEPNTIVAGAPAKNIRKYP